MNKKDLMEMIRNVIAEEMGSSATDMGNYKVMFDGSQIHGLFVSAKVANSLKGMPTGKVLNATLGKSSFEENEYYEVKTVEQVLRNDDGTERTIRTLTISSRGDGKIKENKMKVNQLRQIIREEISKVLKEGKRYSSFEEWKEKVINNPKLKNLSDEELKDKYDEDKEEYESMRRELPDEF